MAFVNFYLIAAGTGSADINAGSSIGAAQATTTNGNWTSATGVFVAASGTPFASTVVGDYASVYIDAATVTTFVGIVTVKTSSTQITIDVTTIKYGTVPTTSATGRSCTINGSWNTEQVLAGGGLGATTVPQSTKVNYKGNLTVAAGRVLSIASSATAQYWLSAYNTTPGDLDNDTTNTLAKPTWTCGTNSITLNAAGALYSGIIWTSTRSGAAVSWAGTSSTLSRCRVINTSANSAASATSISASVTANYSYFSAPTTGTSNAVVSVGSTNVGLNGCVVEGGGLSCVSTTAALAIADCLFINGAVGVTSGGSQFTVIGGTISAMTSDGIKWTGAPSAGTRIAGVLFRALGGYGLNNASGTNTTNVYRACNDYYSCSQGQEFGFGDSPAFFGQTDLSDPVVSASNLTPVAGSNARNNGFPGIFENETFNSYADIGAVRHQDPVGGGYAGGVYGA